MAWPIKACWRDKGGAGIVASVSFPDEIFDELLDVLRLLRRVARYYLPAVIVLSLGFYQIFSGESPALWGVVVLTLFVVIGFLLWIFRPQLEFPGSATILRGPRSCLDSGGRLALTFDDGPNGRHTEAILDVLSRHRARATFFCLGKWALKQPEILQRMALEGHEIGNHSLDHTRLPWLCRADIAHQIDATQDSIRMAGVPAPVLFRAPYGLKSLFLPSLLRERSMKLVAWSRDIQDFQSPGVRRLLRRAYPGLRDGEIFLLHDGDNAESQAERSQTVHAVDAILAECTRRGLRCVTVSELMSAHVEGVTTIDNTNPVTNFGNDQIVPRKSRRDCE
jgi:peptidoglycan/xylan/chitin deacetylase (PgdA/CDA1 family)